MTYIGTKDYNLEVLMGNVPGHAMVFVFGHDDALTTTHTTLFPTATTSNIDQSGIDKTAGTPAVVKVASTSTDDTSAGNNCQTLLIIGLDSSGDAQTEVVSMNGQTEVTSANTYSAVNGLFCVSWGAGAKNAGVIWCGTGTFTSGIPATKYFSMDEEYNKGLSAYYVVANAKTLYLRHINLTLSSSNKDVDFFIETSTNGTNWITQGSFGLESGANFSSPVTAVPGLVAGTHFRIEALSSGSGTDASAVVACELVDD